jgi:DNA-binding response OmpR family regulator
MKLGHYNIERVKFLVVEDNKNMSMMVRSLLHAFGVRDVAEATDGADALKALKHFSADIIICDWVMQPLDGIEFVRMVRTSRDSPNPFVPIIMLTGHTELHRVTEARDAGVNEFLAKPVSARKLYSRIEAIVEHNRQFIKFKNFFGPDRRRRALAIYRGVEHRKKQSEVIAAQEIHGATIVKK